MRKVLSVHSQQRPSAEKSAATRLRLREPEHTDKEIPLDLAVIDQIYTSDWLLWKKSILLKLFRMIFFYKYNVYCANNSCLCIFFNFTLSKKNKKKQGWLLKFFLFVYIFFKYIFIWIVKNLDRYIFEKKSIYFSQEKNIGNM